MTSYGPFFQGLKGYSPVSLARFVLPIPGTDYVLEPIACSDERLICDDVVAMLTSARREHNQSFLTYFDPTEQRTKDWLLNVVGPDDSRVIFSVRSLQERRLYGFLGVAFGDSEEDSIEVDSVARHGSSRVPGLMRMALVELIDWIRSSARIRDGRVRVLSDVRARDFYRACGFVPIKEVPLYAVQDASGHLTALSESWHPSASQSTRTLLHMRWHGEEYGTT